MDYQLEQPGKMGHFHRTVLILLKSRNYLCELSLSRCTIGPIGWFGVERSLLDYSADVLKMNYHELIGV